MKIKSKFSVAKRDVKVTNKINKLTKIKSVCSASRLFDVLIVSLRVINAAKSLLKDFDFETGDIKSSIEFLKSLL